MIKKLSTRLSLLFLLSLCIQACEKAPVTPGFSSSAQVNIQADASVSVSAPFAYAQVNLVSNSSNFVAPTIDKNLVNAWGLVFDPSGTLWSANFGTGTSTSYDNSGNKVSAPISIPSPGSSMGGRPTGIVLNTTSDFKVSNAATKFIFVNQDGVISAWIPGTSGAVTVVDNSASRAVYKGAALASIGASNFIYACNFFAGTIDVFDGSFKSVPSIQFVDAGLPAGYAPFNIQNIGNQLYIMYAKQKGPANQFTLNGVGNGFVDIFNPDGTFVRRFASAGTLNAPWGIAQASVAFGQGINAILIGNFGDGKINVYDADGTFRGQLTSPAQQQAPGSVISIDGLWALTFQNIATGGDPTKLFFAAGPNQRVNGLIGYLRLKLN